MKIWRQGQDSSGRQSPGKGQRGYVLILVMASLALIAFIAGRFALRMDNLRTDTAALQASAKGRLAASSAKAAALYWLVTQSPGPAGFGDSAARQWRADGRWYKLAMGVAGPGLVSAPQAGERRGANLTADAYAALQDQRGLMSINVVDAEPLGRLLAGAGAPPNLVPTLIDTLEDYTDLDSLRRLNGAEDAQYAEAGLLGPRNDWASSVRELCQMPTWSAQGDLCERVGSLLSTRRSVEINPNTASLPVLRALLPGAAPGQIERFMAMREAQVFADVDTASRVSGLPLGRGETIFFFVGDQVRLTVWATGLPRALEYNVRLVPSGLQGPWLVNEMHRVVRPPPEALSENTLEIVASALAERRPER